jgi:hypothetical protein
MQRIILRFEQIGEPFELQFIEAEDETGASVSVGAWSQDADGQWLLTIDLSKETERLAARKENEK